MKSKKKQIIPLGDRVLVERMDSVGEKVVSGIIIPETVDKERPQMGVVIAVGNGRVNEQGKVIPVNVKKGDTVLFSKYGPDEIEIDEENFLIIGESNILAIIK